MSAVGSWKLAAETPVGPQDMMLHILNDRDGTFAGQLESMMGTFDIAGSAIAPALRWETSIKKPLPMTVKFDLMIDGDVISGTAKMGFMGKAKITGSRYASDPQIIDPREGPDVTDIGPITGDFIDPQFGAAYVEVDEWRDDPVRHRYVRGGFVGTDARFSFYFPTAEQYGGRFFHNTYPLITNSDIGPFPIQFDVAVGDLGFTLDSGAYYVQTNLGGQDRAPPADMAIAAYRVNAAAAKFSRKLAAEMYGDHRSYGYLFGGSGGSYQVMGSAEHTQGVWDGFLPFVIGSPNSIPTMFTIRQHALRVLRKRNKLAEIVDAMDPGGSGDPYATLNEEEAAALLEAARLGYPLRGFWDHALLTSGYYANVAPLTPMLDPSYAEDFWSKPGYLGTDPDAGLAELRFEFDTSVANVVEANASGQFPRQIILDAVPARDFADAHLVITQGEHAGESVPIAGIDGHTLSFSMATNAILLGSINIGDPVRIDNSWTLAMQSYGRHQVPPPDAGLYAWDQYRDASGAPIYPQREMLLGPVGADATAGRPYTGNIQGKVLVLECLMDIDAFAWQADWYRSRVKAALGENFDENFAIWFIDNANHENPLREEANARIVSYSGALQQGLRDLAAWVEKGVHPANTNYEVIDTQVVLPESAAARGGIQPVVTLAANGDARADVAVGEAVHFEAVIDVPEGAGQIVGADWDFEAQGQFEVSVQIGDPRESLTLSASHVYTRPGVYFPAIRAASQRNGDKLTKYARVANLARARVVVR